MEKEKTIKKLTDESIKNVAQHINEISTFEMVNEENRKSLSETIEIFKSLLFIKDRLSKKQ